MNNDSPSILTVLNVSEEKQDKNNRTFKTITFSSSQFKKVLDPDTGKEVLAKIKGKQGTSNFYEKSYLDNKEDFLYDSKEGDIILGKIVTETVEPYTIGDNRVNIYTMVIIGNDTESIWNNKVEDSFKRADHLIENNIQKVVNNEIKVKNIDLIGKEEIETKTF